MPTLTTVNAQWTNSITVTDADSRRINAGSFVGDGSALGARGGIVRHGDNTLLVTVNGSDQITVQPGVVAIPSSVALAGVYMAAFGAVTGPGAGTAIATRNATNPRIDLVIADISAGTARIRTVDGTPSSSPVAPSLPAGSIELGRLTVPATGGGAVTVNSTFRSYAAALGGILPVETSARLPGSGNQVSQRAVALDTGMEYSWNGTAWVAAVTAWTAYTPTLSASGGGAALGNGIWLAAFEQTRKRVSFRTQLTLGTTTNFGTGQVRISLPVPPIAAHRWSFIVDIWDVTVGVWAGRAVWNSSANALDLLTAASTAGANDRTVSGSSNIPFAFANGDVIAFNGVYEAA